MERLQLYTFLVDTGMTSDDAIAMIKKYFCGKGKLTEDQFRKEYLYNIQHVYGLVGAKKITHSKGCSSIIEDIPGEGFAYGCPFRYCSAQDIEDLIVSNIDGNHKEAIIHINKALKGKYYKEACD